MYKIDRCHNFFSMYMIGPMFTALHTIFEQQYQKLALAVDETAEQIRALGKLAPGSYSRFAESTQIDEETGAPDAENMIRQMVLEQEAAVRTAREVFPVTEQATDEPTANLLTNRMQTHEITARVLRGLLQ
ncbi:MAG: ferritin-like domain-containing protein [Gammaproteobacteria bacterium]|nr:ferritin-like domain-containing protein [Gammaproteobacteria bacterium]